MGELRQIPFTVIYDNSDKITQMDHPGHQGIVTRNAAGIRVFCNCEPRTSWTHKCGTPDSEIEATFNAHLSFAARPKLGQD